MSKRKDMIEALATSMNREMVPWLIEWIRNPNRKDAIHAFTEGPVRQVAYAGEFALKLERETTPVQSPMTMRPTEQCPRCGFVQHITNGDRSMTMEGRTFIADKDGFISDENFDFDAGLRVTGDFVGYEKRQYAEMIAAALNSLTHNDGHESRQKA